MLRKHLDAEHGADHERAQAIQTFGTRKKPMPEATGPSARLAPLRHRIARWPGADQTTRLCLHEYGRTDSDDNTDGTGKGAGHDPRPITHSTGNGFGCSLCK